MNPFVLELDRITHLEAIWKRGRHQLLVCTATHLQVFGLENLSKSVAWQPQASIRAQSVGF